jgi:hypothetical protein
MMRKKILTKLVGVLLSVDDYLRLVEATNKFEISISEYIRKLTIDDLRKQETEELNNDN